MRKTPNASPTKPEAAQYKEVNNYKEVVQDKLFFYDAPEGSGNTIEIDW